MEGDLSKPIKELPTFMSVASIMHDDQKRIVSGLISSERKSPSTYDAARDFMLRILAGLIEFDWGLAQAKKLASREERKCAIDVLIASKHFLLSAPKARVAQLPDLQVALREDVKIKVSPVWFREDLGTVLILNFWLAPLSDYQKRLSATLLFKALAQTRYVGAELEFVSVSHPELAVSRRCRCDGWDKIPKLSDREFEDFRRRLLAAWDHYQAQPPRPLIRRKQGGLFD